MNKQQLAAQIWASANKMRSKIEANEYKDYILGFIFYKFLSDNEVSYLKSQGMTDENIQNELNEDDMEIKSNCQHDLGYFISYNNLLSTWIKMGSNFTAANVHDALNAFDRLISPTHKKVFVNIFATLQTGLSKLGESEGAQTKAIRELIHLIDKIPIDGKQGYDVLGFIYEYLISNFAANAGKKAGEFYTPHEVCQLMSEIVAHHLKGQNEIKIYDPTSGSGSLLITIGKSVSKYISGENKVKYYAQELKDNTYNLTRMNLVMRGIIPDNIETRCGDTLAEDWPFFDEEHLYSPLYVDAVVSNPPYSQHWDPHGTKERPRISDIRFDDFGYAPKTKADYAFLLHDLYHLKQHGIMTIVLPHGVLFRGKPGDGSEGDIRKNLIERNYIDAVIGLPANIFFGTSIPTIIMVLKKQKQDTGVLFIDASKGFTKEGKNNKLKASDIKKIVDTILERKSGIAKYSRLVSKDEIRKNEYNLNIPRYVDSSEESDSWDIYATMFGGIPNVEIDRLKEYWNALPTLRNELFSSNNTPYSMLAVKDVKETIFANADVKSYINQVSIAFRSFDSDLETELVKKWDTVNVALEESILGNNIFSRLEDIKLINKYTAYQVLDDKWTGIAEDLEIMQTEKGIASVKQVERNMVFKTKDGKKIEVQDGWKGYILPFDLVQKAMLSEKYGVLTRLQQQLDIIDAELLELIDSLSDEEKDGKYLSDNNDKFKIGELEKLIAEMYADIDSPEISALQGYLSLKKSKSGKVELEKYIAKYPEVNWSTIERGKDGTIKQTSLVEYMNVLRRKYSFPEDSFEAKMVKAESLLSKQSSLKKEFDKLDTELHELTKVTIEGLTDTQAIELLKLKWIQPICDAIADLPLMYIDELVKSVKVLSEKYSTTLVEIEKEISESEKALSAMIDQLTGNEYDMKGLKEFKSILDGN